MASAPSLMRPISTLPLGVQQESLHAVLVTGAGTWFECPVDWNGLPMVIDWEVVFPVAPATVSIQLEGTDDPAFGAANIFVLDGPYTALTNTKRWVVEKPCRFVRANLTILTGASASVTARLKNSGKT